MGRDGKEGGGELRGYSDGDASLLAAGDAARVVVADHGVGNVGNAELLYRIFDEAVFKGERIVRREAQLRVVPQLFAHGECREERIVLRNEAMGTSEKL